MKNKRLAFTLVELLAVVVILGVLMMIAIPNTISLLDRNKKTNYRSNKYVNTNIYKYYSFKNIFN